MLIQATTSCEFGENFQFDEGEKNPQMQNSLGKKFALSTAKVFKIKVFLNKIKELKLFKISIYHIRRHISESILKFYLHKSHPMNKGVLSLFSFQ